MSIMRIAGAVALLAVVAAPVHAAPPLQPTGTWIVDYGDAHCIAMRTYGPADSPVTLAFKPSPVGDVMQISVLRKGWNTDVDEYEGSITADGGTPIDVSVLGFGAKARKERVSKINLPQVTFDAIRSARTLRVQSKERLDTTFVVTDMETVARTLRDCVAGLRKHWSLEDEDKLSRPAQPTRPLYSYFGSDDYPRVALHAQATGVVAAVMLIDEHGKVASCMVTQTSGYASLDAQTCAIMASRARFVPALDSTGKTTKSGATYRIRWQTAL